MKRERFTRGIGLTAIVCAMLLLLNTGAAVFASEAEEINRPVSTDITDPAIIGGSIESLAETDGDSSVEPVDEEPYSGSIIMTGYSLQHVGGGEFTGQLEEGGSVDLILNVLDDRTEAGYIPNVRLDTESFTIPGQGDIVCNPKKLTGSGKYKITFKNLTYTGNGKSFSCKIFYNIRNSNGNTVNTGLEIETLSFDVNQAVSATDAEESTGKGTGFILKAASYGQESVYAGQDFSLSASILATNGASNVENVTVSITPPKEIGLNEGSSINYIGTVAPGQTVPVAFSLKPAANIEEGSYDIVIDIKGVNADKGDDVTAQMSITVPILQPERFEIFNAQTPSTLTAGMDDGMGYAEFTLVNQGQGLVSNVSVEIVGDGLSSLDGKQYVGNVAGGEQKTADFQMLASIAGTISGKAVITYENTRGEVKELIHEFTVEVAEGMSMDPGGDEIIDPGFVIDEGSEETGLFAGRPWLLPVIIVAVCAVVAIFVIRFIRKKRAAAAIAEEALLDNQFEDDDETL